MDEDNMDSMNHNKHKELSLDADSVAPPVVDAEAAPMTDAPLTKRARTTKEEEGQDNNSEGETQDQQQPTQAPRRFRRPASSANAEEWHAMYKLLKQYKQEHGHILPKKTETYQDLPLGQWVCTMREAYREEALGGSSIKGKKGGPAPWVITLLNDIGFDWGDMNDTPPFEELVQILQEYKQEKGHVSPKPREVYKQEAYKVGYWAQQLRHDYKVTMDESNPRQPLTPQQIQQLEEMGFQWSVDALENTITAVPAVERHILSWEEMADLLQAYKEEKGHVNPDVDERFRDCNIGFWCGEQRKQYRRKERGEGSNRLSDERVQRLQAMGFEWTRPRKKRRYDNFNQKWESMLQLLKDYLAETNGVYPRREDVYREEMLGRWVYDQRNNYRKRQMGIIKQDSTIMSNARMAKLNDMNFDWELPNAVKKPEISQEEEAVAWKQHYDLLREWLQKKNGVYPRRRGVYKGMELGKWVHTQRRCYRKRTRPDSDPNIAPLSDQRMDILTAIGFKWDPEEETADQLIVKAESGMPIAEMDEEKREEAVKNHAKVFEEDTKNWMEMYQLLKEFNQENGHPHPSATEYWRGRRLGSWVQRQRENYRIRESQKTAGLVYVLSDLHIYLLNELGFSWTTPPHGEIRRKKAPHKKENWEEMFELLKIYLLEHNNKYPKHDEWWRNKPIGRWVTDQRGLYKQKKAGRLKSTNIMNDDRVAKLQHINFKWNARDRPFDEDESTSWDFHYDILRDFYNEKRHSCPTPKDTWKGIQIGIWAKAVRQKYKLRKEGKLPPNSTSMTDDRIARLEAIEFIWEDARLMQAARNRAAEETGQTADASGWDHYYSLLKDFREIYGHVCPSNREVYQDKKLGTWVNNQRVIMRKMKQGLIPPTSYKLSPERINMLNEIGFIWGNEEEIQRARDTADGKIDEHGNKWWNNMYNLLREYQYENRHVCPLEKEEYRGEKLGLFVKRMRSYFKMRQQGKASRRLSDEQIDLLNRIGFVWSDPKQIRASRQEAEHRVFDERTGRYML